MSKLHKNRSKLFQLSLKYHNNIQLMCVLGIIIIGLLIFYAKMVNYQLKTTEFVQNQEINGNFKGNVIGFNVMQERNLKQEDGDQKKLQKNQQIKGKIENIANEQDDQLRFMQNIAQNEQLLDKIQQSYTPSLPLSPTPVQFSSTSSIPMQFVTTSITPVTPELNKNIIAQQMIPFTSTPIFAVSRDSIFPTMPIVSGAPFASQSRLQISTPSAPSFPSSAPTSSVFNHPHEYPPVASATPSLSLPPSPFVFATAPVPTPALGNSPIFTPSTSTSSQPQFQIQTRTAPPSSPFFPPSTPTSTPTTPLPLQRPKFKSAPNQYQIMTYQTSIDSYQIELAKKLVNSKNESSTHETIQQQKKYYQQKYNISKYPQQPFCIVVPSYNNNANNRILNNINSILQQDYSNYHIVFIDDASIDGTGAIIQQFVLEHQISEKKLKVIINKERTMAMPNIYRAAKQECKPYQIFIIVDGDDELIGRQVLKHFNMLFQTNDVWVTYSNFMTIGGTVGYSRPYSESIIQANLYRKAGFVISHLRAFYTKLLTLVKPESLQNENKQWFRAANDVAMYFPLLQMSHRRVLYCPQISYLYNSNTGLNNHLTKLTEQKGNQFKIRQMKPYQQLSQLFTEEEKEELRLAIGNKIEIKDFGMGGGVLGVQKQGWESG